MEKKSWMRDTDQTWSILDRFGSDAISVTEPEEEFSGLYDAAGNPLFRKHEAVGFLPRKS